MINKIIKELLSVLKEDEKEQVSNVLSSLNIELKERKDCLKIRRELNLNFIPTGFISSDNSYCFIEKSSMRNMIYLLAHELRHGIQNLNPGLILMSYKHSYSNELKEQDADCFGRRIYQRFIRKEKRK